MLGGIRSDQARAVWPLAAPILARAIARAPERYSLQTTLDLIEDRSLQLWLAGEGSLRSVLVTEVIAYPQQKACRGVFAAGDLRDFITGIPMVEGWAKAEGCGSIEFNGRRGWEKPMAAAGYVFDTICMRKEL